MSERINYEFFHSGEMSKIKVKPLKIHILDEDLVYFPNEVWDYLRQWHGATIVLDPMIGETAGPRMENISAVLSDGSYMNLNTQLGISENPLDDLNDYRKKFPRHDYRPGKPEIAWVLGPNIFHYWNGHNRSMWFSQSKKN